MKVPGHYVVRQGGHRIAMALEVEGYEIRDCIHAVTVAGVEMWWIARWPVEGAATANVLKHGVGALDIDGCRVGTTKRVPGGFSRTPGKGRLSGDWGYANSEDTRNEGGHNPNIGRWPPNLVFLHADGCRMVGDKRVKSGPSPHIHNTTAGGYGGRIGNVKGLLSSHHADADGKETVPEYECVPGCPVATLDELSFAGGIHPAGNVQDSVCQNDLSSTYKGGWKAKLRTVDYSDAGGASRFFPCFESKEELAVWISRLIGSQTGVE